MSTPAAPPPPAGRVPSAAPAVPYGPGPTTPTTHPTPLSSPITAEKVAKGVGSTALKWGLRILVPLLLRAIFRGVSGR